jgi:nucleolar GTP-binding protein
MRQLDKHITVLNEARTVMRNLPSLDDELFTVAIAGFPNVGKSTLLSKLTTARPEIKPYAFTTKGLNVGYFEHRFNQIQCIDTPGTLHRTKMNAIERKADITLRYLAHCIISVIDPTEQSFTLAQQRTLHTHLEELDKPLFIYVSKTDIASQDQAARVLEMFPDATSDVAALKKAIAHAFKEWI